LPAGFLRPFSRHEIIRSRTMRTIKHYSNRKLYDTTESYYVTLAVLAALLRQGEEIRVVDKATGGDVTAPTLAQIIFEEERRQPHLPVAALHRIIQTGRIP
jgi:polyhydroxyalkanoate synthesis repressor PhaR